MTVIAKSRTGTNRISVLSARGDRAQESTALQDAAARVNVIGHAAKLPVRRQRVDENAPPVKKTNMDRLGDANDPADVHEYDLEIYRHMRSVECQGLPPVDLFDRQSNITARMRSTILDWLVDVHRKMKMHTDTLYLVVNLVDRYLVSIDLDKSKFQRLGCAALLIAAKNMEIYPPAMKDLVKISDFSFTSIALSRMESSLLNAIEFKIDTVVPSMFMKRYLRVARSDVKMSMLAHFVLETSILDADFIGIVPSKIAAAVTLLSMTLLRGPGQWTQYMVDNTGYTVADISETVHKLLQSVSTTSTGRFQAIRKKYASPQTFRVSAMAMPDLLTLE